MRDKKIIIERIDEKYLEKIRPHVQDTRASSKKSGEKEINMVMKPTFMSSTDSNEETSMYSKSDNSIVMIGYD